MTFPANWQDDQSKHDDGQDSHEEDAGHAASADQGHEADASGHSLQDYMDYFLSEHRLIHHVQDTNYFEIPSLSFDERDGTKKIYLPNPLGRTKEEPFIEASQNEMGAKFFGPVTFQPTKFMVLELVAAVLMAVVFIRLGQKIKNGDRPRGRLWNFVEAMVLYVRDDIARPAIGQKDAARYLPFIWTIFFFILILNLFGMIPTIGAATGALGVTAALALITFALVLGAGMKRLGVVGFWTAQAPDIDFAQPVKFFLTVGIWMIEVFGLFIKHFVLAVRLFANMFAGHMVLAVFVAFIGVTWASSLIYLVLPASIVASLMISLLELLVALIQAYVFAFLAALFIGSAIHPH